MPRTDSIALSYRKAFTLIEVITVMVAIAVLSSLLFGVAAGWSEKSKREKARADMAIIQQALEEYRGKFGDYPREGMASGLPGVGEEANEVMLFNALTGRIAPNGEPISAKSMLNYSPLTLRTAAYPDFSAPAEKTSWLDNSAVDPWGNSYQYRCGATEYGYELFSMGPDGTESTMEDNLYAQ